jgi:hypothetical protein
MGFVGDLIMCQNSLDIAFREFIFTVRLRIQEYVVVACGSTDNLVYLIFLSSATK